MNHLFDSSSFGAFGNDANVYDGEISSGQKDTRYKIDENTSRQPKGVSKGADRWPMFYIRIDVKSGERSPDVDEGNGVANESAHIFRQILQLLKTLIHQFLESHNFQPRAKPRRRRKELNESSSSTKFVINTRPMDTTSDVMPQFADEETTPHKKGAYDDDAPLRKRVSNRAFDSWLRVKSGNREAFEHILSGLPRSRGSTGFYRSASAPAASNQPYQALIDVDREALVESEMRPLLDDDVDLLLKDLENDNVSARSAPDLPTHDTDLDLSTPMQVLEPEEAVILSSSTNSEEKTFLWTNPTTGAIVHINSRTGLTAPLARPGGLAEVQGATRPRTSPGEASSGASTIAALARSRLPAKQKMDIDLRAIASSWIGDLMEDTESSVFRRDEDTILSLAPNELTEYGLNSSCHSKFGHYAARQAPGLFEALAGDAHHLSKTALSRSKVLAQVDQKFILVQMVTNRSTEKSSNVDPPSFADEQVLVLIDQHAADERCQVENLYREICESRMTALPKSIQFRVSVKEARLFDFNKEHFASWAFSYETHTGKAQSTSRVHSAIPAIPSTGFSAVESRRLVLTALPELIAERCRLEPRILIDLLRTEIWSKAEGDRASKTAFAGLPNEAEQDGPVSLKDGVKWLSRISTCPKGLIEILKSRACRSAIMFNDVLSIRECESLVRRLSDCSFPFQCAHGRPSMVVLGGLELVDVLRVPETGSEAKLQDDGKFWNAFRNWQDGDM